MTDPYKILGISPNASDEEVKTAYRELARKYHPDRYSNSPLADLASDKMKNINDAYDRIQKMRKVRSGQQYGNAQNSYQQGNYYDGSYSDSSFSDIRRLISENRIAQAEELLDGVPPYSRNAEWYYLKGKILFNRGWLDEAYNCYQQALKLNPQNMEYQNAFNQLSWQRNHATPRSGYKGTTSFSNGSNPGGLCTTCTTLYCANCLCNGCMRSFFCC